MKTMNCGEVTKIDGEIVRQDALAAVYRKKLEEIATIKADLISRKNVYIQKGHCCPVAIPRKDALSGNIIGTDFVHADHCRHKADKLEVR